MNFYRLEHAISFIPMYQAMLEEPIEFPRAVCAGVGESRGWGWR